MNRLGIDYGTTNTVVVASDRGRFPIVPHVVETAVGAVARETFPSLAARDRETGQWLFGFAAERALWQPGAAQRFAVVRSLKRSLHAYTQPNSREPAALPAEFDAADVLRGYAQALRESITRSGLFDDAAPLETVLTWPAHANGAQRYLTRQCFKAAGFQVVATVNEPTAAAIEFADRLSRGSRAAAQRLATSVAVFDLGGGTFDVSLVRIDGPAFHVLASLGIEQLGGDDFDEVLARLFADKLRVKFDTLPEFQRARLLSLARQQKESIAAGPSHTLSIAPRELGLKGAVRTVAVSTYYAALKPWLTRALDKLEELVRGPAARQAGIHEGNLGAIYLVGGSSLLPLVPQAIAERFPRTRRVLSDKPFTATAMGAAIHSAEHVRLHDILSRTFGVIRLADGGRREYFDPIFPAGTPLPRPSEPPLEYHTEYPPQHNIGHLRYLECAALNADGLPAEGIRPWSDARFPYDPAIALGANLNAEPIVFRGDLADQRVRESYTCDADGVIVARVTRGGDQQSAVYEVFRE